MQTKQENRVKLEVSGLSFSKRTRLTEEALVLALSLLGVECPFDIQRALQGDVVTFKLRFSGDCNPEVSVGQVVFDSSDDDLLWNVLSVDSEGVVCRVRSGSEVKRFGLGVLRLWSV